MDRQFWLDRWETSQTGFHQARVNDYLQRYWSSLGLEPGSRVLVPLCGKSLDMLWLAAQGFRVTGIELSEIAAEAFFRENGLQPDIQTTPDCTRLVHDNIELLCSDFFNIEPRETGLFDAFYDRAALIALTREQRPVYAQQLLRLLTPDARGLLITLQYHPAEMNGPPFAVAGEEVSQLFGAQCHMETVHQEDVLDDNARFRDKGVTALTERTYRLAAIQKSRQKK